MNRFFKITVAAFLSLGVTTAVHAAGDAPVPPSKGWSFEGVFGKFDKQSAQRGFQVYSEVCAGCHGLQLVAYRNLMELGYSEEQVKTYAAQFEVSAIDDDGETITKPATPAHKFVPPFPNVKAAAASNGGKAPPDLSLMTKKRMHGPDYVYALLTGYAESPSAEWLAKYEEDHGKAFEQSETLYFNEYFGGYQIAMAPPLLDEGVSYEDGTAATVDQQAKDVVQFLTWAAEPELEVRKAMGFKVMIYLVILLGLFVYLKRKVWSDLH